MCRYLETNSCKITKTICPWIYYCNKKKQWIFKSEGEKCKVLKNQDIPKGYYPVRFEKRNRLYVDVNGNIVIIPNPFDEVPLYVKVYKTKDGKWRIKK